MTERLDEMIDTAAIAPEDYGLEVTRAEDWVVLANCGDATSEELFGPEGETMKDRNVREHRVIGQYCLSCVVRTECLDAALNRREYDGVWGGTSEADRRAYLRNKISREEIMVRSEARRIQGDIRAYHIEHPGTRPRASRAKGTKAA